PPPNGRADFGERDLQLIDPARLTPFDPPSPGGRFDHPQLVVDAIPDGRDRVAVVPGDEQPPGQIPEGRVSGATPPEVFARGLLDRGGAAADRRVVPLRPRLKADPVTFLFGVRGLDDERVAALRAGEPEPVPEGR